MKVRLFLVSLFLVVGGVNGAVAQSLSDTLATTYKNSGLIEQNRAVLRAADEDVAQAVAALRPVLNWAATLQYQDTVQREGTTGTLGLSAEMLLYDFGQSQLGIDAAKETVLATRATLIDAENTTLFNAVRTYVGVQRAQAFVELRENNVRLLTQQLRATRDRFEVGEVTRTDISLAEARLAAARSGLAAEQGGLAQAREAYRAVVGEYPGRLSARPTAPSIPGSKAQAFAVARDKNPSLKRIQHQVKAAELLLQSATMARRPTLNATGNLSVDDDGNEAASLGLRLSGPIYQGGAISSRVRQARAARDEARALLYSTGLQVDQEIGNAYANLAVAVASVDAFDRQVRASELALRGVREEFQLGARTTLDVLDQEQEVLDARTNRVSAQSDRYVAIYEVLNAIGLLTAEHLGLNVPIYDPAGYYNAVQNAPLRTPSKQGAALDRVMRSLGKE